MAVNNATAAYVTSTFSFLKGIGGEIARDAITVESSGKVPCPLRIGRKCALPFSIIYHNVCHRQIMRSR